MIKSRISRIHSRLHPRQLTTHQDHQLAQPVMSTRPATSPPKSRRPIHHREVDMSAIPLPQAGQQVFLTIHWKDKLDDAEPRWRHWFFSYIYLPFQRLSFKLGIPRAKEATITADKEGRTYTTFSWFENGSVFPTAEQADAACFNDRDGYKPLYWGEVPPRRSGEIGGLVFPRAKNPRRWTRPTLALIITPRKEQEQIRAEVKRLREILDQ